MTTGTYECFLEGVLPVDVDELLLIDPGAEVFHLPLLRIESALPRWEYYSSTVESARVNEIVLCLGT